MTLASGIAAALALALAAAAPVPTPAAAPARAAPRPLALVVSAPGWPGTTEEAQPSLDALLAAAGPAASGLDGVYLPEEEAGVARLQAPGAALALVPLPFYAKHARALRLAPRLSAVREGDDGPSEVWTLVAKKGRVSGPAALAGFTIRSTAGYAPGFVRDALAGFGPLPAGVTIAFTPQVLSALRQAASGAPVAVLLDGPQARALTSLPFAGELEVVARSGPVPVAVVATVDARLPAARWAALERGLLALPESGAGRGALAGMRLVRFTPLDAASRAALERVR